MVSFQPDLSRLKHRTFADILEGTTRKEILRSPALNTFLQGPAKCSQKPGHQPEGSGRHYDPAGGSILNQFPSEIINKIASYLDPVWMFQLEKAVPELGDYLHSQEASSVWYGVLPAAMLLQPEMHQSEDQKGLKEQRFCDMGLLGAPGVLQKTEVGHNVRIHHNTRQSTITPLANTDRQLQSRATSPRSFCLPSLPGVSTLAHEIALKPRWDVRQHQPSREYPIIKFPDGTYRVRTLALGGPFMPHISYRREILGRMLSFRSPCCCLCLEKFPETTGRHLLLGLPFCKSCYDALMWIPEPLGSAVTKHVTKHLKSRDMRTTATHRVDRYRSRRLAVADAASQELFGVDMKTAEAKDAYFQRLAKFKNKGTALEGQRRKIRHKIIEKAQSIWDRDLLSSRKAKYWKASFLPSRLLGEVLFAPVALNHNALPQITESCARMS